MQKRKQKSFLKRIILTLIFSLSVLTLLALLDTVKAEEMSLEDSISKEPTDAPNSIFIKEFKAEHNPDTRIMSGEADIINLGNQSFHDLDYSLALLAYGHNEDLGYVVHEEVIDNNFSIAIQGEVKKSFSYKIPEGVPSGEYNFFFQVIDSKGRRIAFDYYPLHYSNDVSDLLISNSESIKIEVNKEDYNWGEGPTTKKGDEVRLKFELTNSNQASITNVTPHLTIYPYTPSLKKVKEVNLESFSLNPGETKDLSYQMPEFTNPQSYLAVIELKKDNKLIALPIRGRWVVEGIQGKIFTAGIDKNNNLTLEVIGSPFTEEESGTVIINILDENGTLCFSQEKEIAEAGAGTQIISLPINFQKQCNNPTLKVELKIKDQLVDTYEEKLDSDSIGQLQAISATDGNSKIDKKKIALLFLIVPTIIILISLIVIREKGKGKKIVSLLLLVLSGTILFSFLSIKEAKAWTADAGHYLSMGNSYLYNPYFFPSSDQPAIRAQRACLNARNDYCFVGSRLRYENFNRVQWNAPYSGQSFDIGESIRCSVSNVRTWCWNIEFGTTIIWNVFSREAGSKIKSGTIYLRPGVHSAGWSINSLPEGKYAMYLNTYCSPPGYGNVILYHGMIRYFEIIGPQCGPATTNNVCLDSQPTTELCGDKSTLVSPPSVTYANGAWNWSCALGGINVPCSVQRNPQCGDAVNEASLSKPEENLCNLGDHTPVLTVDGKWSWLCGNGTCEPTRCYATKETVTPFCSLTPHSASICSGETSTVTVDTLAPAKGSSNLVQVDWNSSNSDESGSWNSTQPDTYNNISWNGEKFLFNIEGPLDLGSNLINFLVNEDTGSYETQCDTTIYVKPASCNISVSPSDNLIAGTPVNISITPECMEADSYDLDILYQDSPNPASWEYDGTEEEFIADLNNDGEVIIKIKEAGLFTFEATVSGTINGSDGASTECDCQTTAFTSGSKWWERDTE